MSNLKSKVSVIDKYKQREKNQRIEINKEYSNGILIYEGELLNGKRNGKGKEYNNGKLVYEGEF